MRGSVSAPPLVGSDVQQPGDATRDSGGQVQVDYDMGNGWRQQLYALHLGDRLQLNDFGYLERNNFNYLRYELSIRSPTCRGTSSYASHDFRYAVSRRTNDHGVHIADALSFDLVSDLRNGGNDFLRSPAFTPGPRRPVTRGNGVVDVAGASSTSITSVSARARTLVVVLACALCRRRPRTARARRAELDFNPTYFVNDNLSFYAELFAQHNPDWLIWQHDNLLGSFRADMLQFNGGVQWIISAKQELRVKLETIALDARAAAGLARRSRWHAGGHTDDPEVSDFSLRNLGFQIRYRYELAPLSNLYIAYVRGGFGFRRSRRTSARCSATASRCTTANSCW